MIAVPRRTAGGWAAVLALALAATVARPAHAAEPTEAELAVARDRFREGLALEEQGNYRAARAKFELVAETRTSPQVLYHLAFCDEKLDHLVAALAGYDRAIAAAEAAGDAGQAVVEEARPRRDALGERIPRVRVAIEGELAAGDQVTIDGEPVETWSEDTPVDPGPRRVAIVRDGAPVVEAGVQAVVGERAVARLVLPTTADPAPPPVVTPPPPDDAGGDGGAPTAALVVGGVGVAALVAGGVTLALQQVAIEDVRVTCADPDGATGCDPASRAREEDARTLGVTSGILLGVGGACLATGIVLWIALDDEPSPSPAARATARGVAVAPGPLGLTARGRF